MCVWHYYGEMRFQTLKKLFTHENSPIIILKTKNQK